MQTYKSYSEYFENLVENSIYLSHDPDNNKKAFFRINLEEVLTGVKQQITAEELFFVLTNYIWKPEYAGGSYIKKGEGMFFIMGTAKEGDYENETEVLDACEKLAQVFINRINLDSRKETPDDSAFWYGMQDVLKIENVVPLKWNLGKNHIGVQVTFEFASTYNECNLVDDWDDLNTPDDIDPSV